MPFLNAIVYGFNNFFNFRGKVGRPQYWYFYLFAVIANQVISWLQKLGSGSNNDSTTWIILALTSLLSLGISIPQLALTVRRFRDAGFSPLLLLLSLIPAAAGVWLVATYFSDLASILTLGGVSVHSLGEWVTAAQLVAGLLASPAANVYLPYFTNCIAPLAITALSAMAVGIFFIIVLTRPSKPEAVSIPAVDSEATA